MNSKSTRQQPRSFSLVSSPLKSARRMLGLERELAKKLKYEEDAPESLRAGEFPVVNLENDPIGKLIAQL